MKKRPLFDNFTYLLDLPFILFRALMSYKVYRYLAAGGVCFALNFIIFHVSYHYLSRYVHIIVPNSTVAIACSLSVTLVLGFFLNNWYVFPNSHLRRSVQFGRYMVSNIFLAFTSSAFLHLLIDEWHWQITLAFLTSVATIQTLNFFIQHFFSFKGTSSGLEVNGFPVPEQK